MEKGDGQRKGPKFNIYWVYGIIAIVLILAQVMNFSPELKVISEQQFRNEILLPGEIGRASCRERV